MAVCSSCGASIIWLRTPAGKWMPANEGLVPYRQSDKGNNFVVDDRGNMIRCVLEFEGFPTGMARIPHWATCPNAAKHKRR